MYTSVIRVCFSSLNEKGKFRLYYISVINYGLDFWLKPRKILFYIILTTIFFSLSTVWYDFEIISLLDKRRPFLRWSNPPPPFSGQTTKLPYRFVCVFLTIIWVVHDFLVEFGQVFWVSWKGNPVSGHGIPISWTNRSIFSEIGFTNDKTTKNIIKFVDSLLILYYWIQNSCFINKQPKSISYKDYGMKLLFFSFFGSDPEDFLYKNREDSHLLSILWYIDTFLYYKKMLE